MSAFPQIASRGVRFVPILLQKSVETGLEA